MTVKDQVIVEVENQRHEMSDEAIAAVAGWAVDRAHHDAGNDHQNSDSERKAA